MPEDGMISEDDFLPISGLQHFAFCPRRWALVQLEGLWEENILTVEGEILHKKAHDETARESRGDTLIIRGLRVFSATLGLVGMCDVVEFHKDMNGVNLTGKEGLWRPFPVEYKRGGGSDNRAYALQLCAQAICLEEMLCCTVASGALFYGETRRRQTIDFDNELRNIVADMAKEMHSYTSRGYTPKVKPRKGCKECSLKNLCLPVLQKKRSAAAWVTEHLREAGGESE